jgi:small multidrug resistance family-3 protein
MLATLNVEVRCNVKREAGPAGTVELVMSDTIRSILFFALAAVLEIGGAWLVWQGVREHRGIAWIGAGIVALGAYGFVATFQSDPNFGRILAAYGGVFVTGSLLWGVIADGFRPDRYDLIGAAICLAGVGVIMYAPRPG